MFLRQLKYFIAIVESTNFTEAAEKCYISQSNISQQIHALEEELQVKLLEKQGRKCILTPAGEYFYRQALLITEETDRAIKNVRAFSHKERTSLKIGYLRSYTGREMSLAIDSFTQKHPETDIDLISGNHEEIYQLLRQGEANLVLNDQRRALSNAYVNFHLAQVKCYAEISNRSMLSTLKYITLEELRLLPCILISSKAQQTQEVEYYKNTLGLLSNFIFAETNEEAELLVIANKGFLLYETVTDSPATEVLYTRIPILQQGEQLCRNYFLFWPKEKDKPIYHEFAEELKLKFVAK